MKKLLIAIAILLLLPSVAFGWTELLTFEGGTPGTALANEAIDSKSSGTNDAWDETTGYSGSPGPWPEWNTFISTGTGGKVYDGNVAMRMYHPTCNCGDNQQKGGENVSSTSEIWYGSWQYLDNWDWDDCYPDGNANKIKWMRLRMNPNWVSIFSNDAGDILPSCEFCSDSSETAAYNNSQNDIMNQVDRSEAIIPTEQWYYLEYHVKFSTGGSAELHIFVNGVMVFKNTGFSTQSSSTSYAIMRGTWNSQCTANSSNMTMYVDDVKFTNEEPTGTCTDPDGGNATPCLYADLGGGDVSAPVLSAPLPSTEQTCTSDPRNVTIQVTATDNTDVTACKYDATDVAMASMSGTLTEGGSDVWSDTVSNACDSSPTYYARCKDAADNESGATTISYTVGISMPIVTNVTLMGGAIIQ